MNRRIAPLPLSVLLAALSCCASDPPGRAQRAREWDDMRSTFAFEAEQHAPSGASAAPDEELNDLDDLLRFARAHNPALGSSFERWKDALTKASRAGALPEPRLTFAAYLSEVETRVGPMQARIGLMQPLPWFGELDAAANAAFEASEAARWMLGEARLELDRKVRDAWYELAWLERAIEITAGNRELVAHWESVSRARMETGQGAHADVLRAQIELGKLDVRVRSLSDLRTPLRAELNAALGRAAEAPLPTATLPEVAATELDTDDLRDALLERSPQLSAHRHRIAAAEHELELANKAFYPDLSLGLEYTVIGSADAPGVDGSGDDALALSLGIDLPLRRSAYRAGARGAEARVRAARLDLASAELDLGARLQRALYRLRDAERRVELYRDGLVPKGEEAVRALDVAYQAGDEGFLDLIDAQRALLEFQLQAARAQSDRAQALAEIERITGLALHTEDL